MPGPETEHELSGYWWFPVLNHFLSTSASCAGSGGGWGKGVSLEMLEVTFSLWRHVTSSVFRKCWKNERTQKKSICCSNLGENIKPIILAGDAHLFHF